MKQSTVRQLEAFDDDPERVCVRRLSFDRFEVMD